MTAHFAVQDSIEVLAVSVHPEEHGANSVPEIVLGYALWHSQFNEDPAAVGRTVQINKHPYTIIGVAPQNFRGTELDFSRFDS